MGERIAFREAVDTIEAPNDSALLRRGLRLEYLTLGWNVIGAVVVIAAAILARSVALAAFGLDSLIEIFASGVVVWQLKGVGLNRERRALRLIGLAFFSTAAYVLAQVVYSLTTGANPETSPVGIAWLGGTFVVMLLLAWGKRNTGQKLGNSVLMTEARVTLIDGLLAAAVLTGLVLNAAFGWWWADPLSALVVVYYAVREGLRAWRE